MIRSAHFILFVSSQSASVAFYEKVLGHPPRLNVPGMTEFTLRDGAVLGLMPSAGIKRLFGNAIADPESAVGIPRAELYLLVDDARHCHQRALAAGAVELSAVVTRDWGHDVGYLCDLDGHLLAFANEPAR